MAKLVVNRHQPTQHRLKPQSLDALSANILAGQLRCAIISQGLPKLCSGCRRLLMLKRKKTGEGVGSPTPARSSLCLKYRGAIDEMADKGRNAAGQSIADRFMSFVQSFYSGPCSSSIAERDSLPKKEIEPKPAITTRNRVDSHSVYPYLTALNRPWCRYCGVTVSSEWKTGPWGKASLCNSHGPDGAGNEQFDLHRFECEGADRVKPILSDYCCSCWSGLTLPASDHLTCYGCSLSFHKTCGAGKRSVPSDDGNWYCSPECLADRKKRIVRGKIGFDERMPFTINPAALPPVERQQPVQPDIFVPKFTQIARIQPRLRRASAAVERELDDMDDAHCSKRHLKYEQTERNNHLLRPHIMRKLFPKVAAK